MMRGSMSPGYSTRPKHRQFTRRHRQETLSESKNFWRPAKAQIEPMRRDKPRSMLHPIHPSFGC